MNRAARSFNTVCAILVTLGALAALAGWLFHIAVLTRLNPAFIPTQFNTALGFLCYGLGLGALNARLRWISRGLAGVALVIGLASLFEHLTGVDLGIDTVSGFYLTGPGIAHPGRIATSTAIAVSSLGGALILFSLGELTERRSAILAALGGMVAAVGLGGFLAYAAHLQSRSGWVGFTQMGFPTAALCLLSGTNVLLNVRSRFKASATWLPIPLCAGLLALLITLTNALSADQDAALSARAQIAAQGFAAVGRSNLPVIFFIAGLVFTGLITLSFFLALRWRQNFLMLKEREAALERSEERYELAVRGSGVGLWDRNVVTGELYLSPRVLEIMDFPPGFAADRNELLGRVHPHDIGTVGPELFRAVQQKRPYDVEGRVRRRDDTYIWVRLRGVPVFDAAGTLVRVAGSLDDITALKKAEAALKASEESFRNTMDSAAVGMALISPAAKLVRGNKALSTLTGYSEAEMLTMRARDLFPDSFDEDRRQIARLLSGEIAHYEMEQMFIAKGGKPVWVLTNATLARNPDGSPQHVVKQLLNISERKEMDRMKSEFISVVSHELRTPLTAIRGSLGIMATAMRDSLPPKALHLVEIGYRNSERLIALVNDILDMEKLAANRMPFESRLEDLAALTQQAVESNAAYAEKYKVAYLVENRVADLPVRVDPDRLAQVFANLLSNAAKFSPEGGHVRVVICTRQGRARIEVIDRGPGIAEEFKPRIFGRFAQADSSINRVKGGTGLGLHITRELVERMGGAIGFDSVAGEGTKFWVEFPIAEAVRETAAAPAAPHIPRILHVEDDADLTAMLAAALKGRAELIAARTLKEAKALLEQRSFAAIILDVGMPDGSGLSLIEGIGAVANPPPVIILSARELDSSLTRNAAATLVKSRIAESEIAQIVLDMMAGAPPKTDRAAS
jgi:PAS domain S-box-containing protein